MINSMKKAIRTVNELISPDLKGNKHYEFVELEEKTECVTCKKMKKRGMKNRESQEFFCTNCYVRDKGSELKVTITKRKIAIIIATISAIFLIQTSIIVGLIILSYRSNDVISYRDAIVDFFYPFTDTTVSKDLLALQIDTIIKHSEYPELAMAIVFRESRFNPAAKSKTGARGPYQVLAGMKNNSGWMPKLLEEKVITDYRDLHDPIKGIIAGDKVLGYHITRANGDLMATLRDYVGSRTTAEQTSYVRDVLATYGNIMLLKVAVKQRHNDIMNDGWWSFNEKDKLSKQVNPTKKGRK